MHVSLLAYDVVEFGTHIKSETLSEFWSIAVWNYQAINPNRRTDSFPELESDHQPTKLCNPA